MVSFSCVEGTTAFSPQPGLGSYLTSFERLLQVLAIYESVNAHRKRTPNMVSFSCVEGTTAFSPQPGLGSYLTSFERLLLVLAIYESVNAI